MRLLSLITSRASAAGKKRSTLLCSMEMFTCRSSSLELFDIIDVLSRDQVEILETLLPVFSVVTCEILP